MSSLAAARADNFYYPPEYDPSKGSLNQFNGQHPLRDRARKLDQGILIIRFEMPFNAWYNSHFIKCTCGHLIGKGVRFNAEKKAIGNYYSTKIWAFTMRAPCCQRRIEIHTDPKNHKYNIVEGAKEKAETWTAADAETMELDRSEDRAKLDDPLAKLEHVTDGKRRAKQTLSRITELVIDADIKFGDDYAINKLLRSQNRAKRKDEQHLDRRRQALGLPDTVPLLPEHSADVRQAALVTFGDAHAFDKARRIARDSITHGSIFSPRAMAAGKKQIAAAARAREDAAARAAAGAAVLRSAAAAGSSRLPRRLAVLQSNGGCELHLPSVERRDEGRMLNDSKPPVAPLRGVATAIVSAADSERGPAFSSILSSSVPRGISAALGVRKGCVPVVMKRKSNNAAAQLALKRRRLEHGVKLTLSDPWPSH